MASTLLEQTRSNHEEVERLERLVVQDLQKEPPSSRDRLVHGHRVRKTIESIMLTTKKLVSKYEDKDGAREDEIGNLLGNQNVYSEFYDRLKEIREYQRKHPCGRLDEAVLKEEPVIAFSGEEGFGRYLDLHDLYNQYINSKFGERIEYSSYLDVFSQPPRKPNLSRQYRNYIEALLEYLVYFFQRTQPLQDLDLILSKVEEQNEVIPSEHVSVIDLDDYTRVEELLDVGPGKLKEALRALGLKVGGTPQQLAERLFLTKHIPLEKLDKKHFANGKHCKDIALTEAKVKKLCSLLDETIQRTKLNIVKKESMSYEDMESERQGEEEEEEEEANAESESDDEEDGQIYNPLKLPMGSDGKPIPYWLYILHGLGREFKCEICGDYIYLGRRVFERHFKQGRHQHGMHCLGIPNTNNFNEITSIEEAKELWKRIQESQVVNKWRPELEEEYEDQQGNVYNKKTYSDLQRQGLI